VVVTRSKGFDRTTGDGGYIVDGPIWMKGSLGGGSVFLIKLYNSQHIIKSQ
jgi:hypothetical protein